MKILCPNLLVVWPDTKLPSFRDFLDVWAWLLVYKRLWVNVNISYKEIYYG